MRHFLLSLIIPINIFLQLADFYNKKLSKKLHQNKYFKNILFVVSYGRPKSFLPPPSVLFEIWIQLVTNNSNKKKTCFSQLCHPVPQPWFCSVKSVENKVSWFHFEALGFIKSSISLKAMGLVLVSLRPIR